jgi:hypothetical protein
MISVLDGRLELASKKDTDFTVDPPRFVHYDAIPHQFSNQELGAFIGDHPKYKETLLRWIGNITDKYTSERIELGRLINLIGGPYLDAAIQDLIATGEKENLKKVIALFPLMDPPDFRLCFEVIAATDDKEILNYVGGKMRNTGAMSGGYYDDLYGDGLRSVKHRLEREGLLHPDKKVKDFCNQMIDNLDRDIAASAERHKKEVEERTAEFRESKLD